MSTQQDEIKQVKDHNILKLEIIANKIGLHNAVVEDRKLITGDHMEYAIMAKGYLTSFDIKFLKEQKFEIVGIYATGLDELMILVEEVKA